VQNSFSVKQVFQFFHQRFSYYKSFGSIKALEAMRKIYELDSGDIVPTHQEILAQQKMPARSVSLRITRMMDDAIGLFQDLAQPRGLAEDFNAGGFPDIYKGIGLNAPDCPFPSIIARANATALMAATMGDALAVKSSELFAQGKASLGYMLDVVNSAGAERLGCRMCGLFLERLRAESCEGKNVKVQYYCPGHCGWHISGQEKLFGALNPGKIGVSLNERWVMRPLKSISGIMAAAPIDVHRFRQGFSFCPRCRDRKCAERFKLLETE
jgi:hypothetical protein